MIKYATADFMYYLMHEFVARLENFDDNQKEKLDIFNANIVFSQYPSARDWEVL